MKATHIKKTIELPEISSKEKINNEQLMNIVIKYFTDKKDYKSCYFLNRKLKDTNCDIEYFYREPILNINYYYYPIELKDIIFSLNDLEKDYKNIFKKDIKDYDNLEHFYIRYSSFGKTIKKVEDF